MQQLPTAPASANRQLHGDSVNLAPVDLNAVQAPDSTVPPTASTMEPVDEREALHAAVLGLAGTAREQDTGKSRDPQVSFRL